MKKIILIDNNLGNGETFFNSYKFFNFLNTTTKNYDLKIKIEHDFFFNSWVITFSNKNKSFCFNVFLYLSQQDFNLRNVNIYDFFSFLNIEEAYNYVIKEVEKLNLIPKKIILLEKRISTPPSQKNENKNIN